MTLIIIITILAILLIFNYFEFVTSLYKTYNYHLHSGGNVFHSDVYFKTWKELLMHAIPFYYFYLFILKVRLLASKLK